MIDLKEIFKETKEETCLINESGVYGNKINHIFNDEKLTFGEIRNIFRSVFGGKTELYEKLDGINIAVTYKDGGFKYARNKKELKDPLDIEKLGLKYEGKPQLKEAFVNTANNIGKALQALDTENFTKIFNNGKNYLNIDIIYPPLRNVMDYGNKCLLQLNSIDIYDENYNKLDEDRDNAKIIFEMLKKHNALKQELFEISKPNILRIKNSVDAEDACNDLMTDIDKLVDGIGYRASIFTYSQDRLKRYIINCATRLGIDVDMNSQFVDELANRINILSHKRPTKTDLICYAKKDGIKYNSDEYKQLLNTLHSSSEYINEEIMQPVYDLILKASTLLFKNLIGYLAADPNKNTNRILFEIENSLKQIGDININSYKEVIKKYNKTLDKIYKYTSNPSFPTEGVIFNYTNNKGITKTYKLIGNFGQIQQMMKILR